MRDLLPGMGGLGGVCALLIPDEVGWVGVLTVLATKYWNDVCSQVCI